MSGFARPICFVRFAVRSSILPATGDNTCEICVAPVFVPQIKPCWDCFGDQQIPDTFEIFASMAPLPADNQVTHTYQRTTVDKRTNTSAVSTSSWTRRMFRGPSGSGYWRMTRPPGVYCGTSGSGAHTTTPFETTYGGCALRVSGQLQCSIKCCDSLNGITMARTWSDQNRATSNHHPRLPNQSSSSPW